MKTKGRTISRNSAPGCRFLTIQALSKKALSWLIWFRDLLIFGADEERFKWKRGWWWRVGVGGGVCGTGLCGLWLWLWLGRGGGWRGEGAGSPSTSGGGADDKLFWPQEWNAEIVVDLAAQHEANRNFQHEP